MRGGMFERYNQLAQASYLAYCYKFGFNDGGLGSGSVCHALDSVLIMRMHRG